MNDFERFLIKLVSDLEKQKKDEDVSSDYDGHGPIVAGAKLDLAKKILKKYQEHIND